MQQPLPATSTPCLSTHCCQDWALASQRGAEVPAIVSLYEVPGLLYYLQEECLETLTTTGEFRARDLLVTEPTSTVPEETP
jgi:hypothetical protein